MRYLSLFSGVEAASLAWKPLGFEAVAFAETDPFAAASLSHRFPETPNLGDVCNIGEAELEKLGRIDVTIFGSPCQDFSIAGKREGLENEDGERTRSGLFHEAIRIVRLAARINGCRWFVMENVPGMLSTGGGRDFAEVVREISGYSFSVPRNGWRNGGVVRGREWSVAWRTLDARFFGVPQRRRRVFLVGHLGNWTNPAAILFVGQSLSRNPPSSGKAKANLARSLKGGLRGGGGQSSSDGQETLIPTLRRSNDSFTGTRPVVVSDHSPCLTGNPYDNSDPNHQAKMLVMQNYQHVPDVAFAVQTEDRRAAQGWNSNLIAFDCRAGGNTGFSIGETAGTLRGEGHGGGHAAIVCTPISADAANGRTGDAETPCADADGRVRLRPPSLGVGETGEPSFAVSASAVPAVAYSQATPINMRLTARGEKMTNNRQEGSSGGAPGTGIGEPGDPCPTLGMSHTPAIAYGISSDALDRSGEGDGSAAQRAGLGIVENASAALRARSNNSVAYAGQHVRRLTPTECERLQGMPEDWTLIPYKGKPAEKCPDSPRYRSIGNSFAVPVVRWLGKRLSEVAEQELLIPTPPDERED